MTPLVSNALIVLCFSETVCHLGPQQYQTMAGQQRTFQLIPESLVKTSCPVKAMTSKQAKKAYQKRTNNGTKVSRAEQARLDREELDRQKKEYEKERASRRAKAARDKKAQKAEEEKAKRKSNGLPEPNKHVRASQPRISMFVSNGKGNKRSWKEMDNTTEDIGYKSDTTIDCQEQPSLPKRIARDDNSEDEFGDFPSLSQTNEVLNNLNGGTSEESVEFAAPGLKLPLLKVNNTDARNNCNENLEDDELDELVTAQLVSETDDAIQRALSSPFPQDEKNIDRYLGNSHRRPPSSSSKDDSRSESHEELRSSFKDQSINVAPHELSKNTAKSIPFAIITPDHQNTIQRSFRPSATQTFLERHTDSFFPSPSQQVRELLEDFDDMPSNTQIAHELNETKASEDYSWGGMFSTQDLVLSPQDLLEITTPCKPPTKTSLAKKPHPEPFTPLDPAYSMRQAPNNKPKMNWDTLRDMKTSEAPSRPFHVAQPLDYETSMIATEQDFITKTRPLQLPDQGDRACSPQLQDISPQQQPISEREDLQTSGSHIKHHRRFFEEKEEDLLYAALHESRAAPLVELKQLNSAPMRRAPMNVPSKETAKTVPVQEAPKKATRTFQRIQSTITDYGDEEFNEQELLALC